MKLSSVMSGTGGVVATKIIDRLIDGRQISMADIDEVYHHRLNATKEELLEAGTGYVTEHHVFMLRTIREDTASTEGIISSIDGRIKEMLAPYDNVLALLKEVPGLGDKSIEDFVAETGPDMSVFPSDKHLCSWAGIAPGNNESAGKKKWTHTAGKQICKNSDCGGGVGGDENEEHVLQCEVSPVGSKTGQKESPGRRGTFDPEVCLPHTEHPKRVS